MSLLILFISSGGFEPPEDYEPSPFVYVVQAVNRNVVVLAAERTVKV